MDSPGVTEEEGSSAARQITEQFQQDHACGYVYILDGTRAAEEAAQVRASTVSTSRLRVLYVYCCFSGMSFMDMCHICRLVDY